MTASVYWLGALITFALCTVAYGIFVGQHAPRLYLSRSKIAYYERGEHWDYSSKIWVFIKSRDDSPDVETSFETMGGYWSANTAVALICASALSFAWMVVPPLLTLFGIGWLLGKRHNTTISRLHAAKAESERLLAAAEEQLRSFV